MFRTDTLRFRQTDRVARKEDPTDSWDILRRMYNSGDQQQQILYLTNKIHSISLKEGGDVTTYLMEASNLRNHLSALGETILDRQLVNIVLNGLARSFDMVIQGISYMTNPTFEDVMGKILMESQRMTIRDNKIGQEEACTISYSTSPLFIKLPINCEVVASQDLLVYITLHHQICFTAASLELLQHPYGTFHQTSGLQHLFSIKLFLLMHQPAQGNFESLDLTS